MWLCSHLHQLFLSEKERNLKKSNRVFYYNIHFDRQGFAGEYVIATSSQKNRLDVWPWLISIM